MGNTLMGNTNTAEVQDEPAPTSWVRQDLGAIAPKKRSKLSITFRISLSDFIIQLLYLYL
jgi:hypothetical protein